jgi:hypothetical protein
VSKSLRAGPADFPKLLREIKARIQQAQMRAVLSVNAELVHLYWDIGRMIDGRQRREGWGAAIIPRLARELHNELPEEKGFSERNIKRMLAFYRAYPSTTAKVPQPVAQLPSPKVPPPVAQLSSPPIVPQLAAQIALSGASIPWSIPWSHHVILMEKIKDQADRFWYMCEILDNGWSRNVLLITRDKHHRRQPRTPAQRARKPQKRSGRHHDEQRRVKPHQRRQIVRKQQQRLIDLQGYRAVGISKRSPQPARRGSPAARHRRPTARPLATSLPERQMTRQAENAASHDLLPQWVSHAISAAGSSCATSPFMRCIDYG